MEPSREVYTVPLTRKPSSVNEVKSKRLSRNSTPPHFLPRRQRSTASSLREVDVPSRLSTSSSMYRPSTAPSADIQEETVPYRSHSSQRQHLSENESTQAGAQGPGRPPPSRQSSLRYERSFVKPKRMSAIPSPPLVDGFTDGLLEAQLRRPRSLPPSEALHRSHNFYDANGDLIPIPPIPASEQPDPWALPSLQQTSVSRSSSQRSVVLRPKPKASFTRLQSLDSLITYREDKAEWKRESLYLQSALSEPEEFGFGSEELKGGTEMDEPCCHMDEKSSPHTTRSTTPSDAYSDEEVQIESPSEPVCDQDQPQPKNKFRGFAAEVGFCFTIAMTQFLAEYLISGFAIELPRIVARMGVANSSMGTFWPASLLSLILSATLLIFARISDMYGGYMPFMFGVCWLAIWSLVAGFADAVVVLDVARAMQGLAIAAFIPSTFAMIGSIYPDGPRKNTVLGLYAGCAPLGFFAGFLTAGALPENAPGWYFWIAAALSFITVITAYLTVPHDRTDREVLDLKMDWAGSFLITGGLILVAYALAVEPYAEGWSSPFVLGPLISGIGCLAVAFWVEGWVATCPLIPFDFFKPKSTKAFSLACLCFYASYGVWLYESAQFFQSPSATGTPHGIQGVTLALWYVPTALGGLILCVAGGALLHVVPIMALLLVSGLAWIAAPLLLALCPLPMSYWAFVMPSMLCATIGIDLTFTVSVVFLSAGQPLKYQGLAGAVSSILVNLAMSFSLSISEIAALEAESSIALPETGSSVWTAAKAKQSNWGFQAAFIYAAASAGLGLIITVLFVRISRSVVSEKPVDEERSMEETTRGTSSEAPTLVARNERKM